jgi:hypothetical protein
VLAVDLPLRCPPLPPPHTRIRPYEALSFPLASPSLALSPSSSLRARPRTTATDAA